MNFASTSAPETKPIHPRWVRLLLCLGVASLIWFGDISVASGIASGQASLKKVVANTAGVLSEPTNTPEADKDLGEVASSVEERLTKARADLAVMATLDEFRGSNLPPGETLKDSVIRRGLLERLVRLYEQQLSYVTELELAKSRRSELAHEAQSWTGFAEPRPHSILLADALQEGIQMERQQIANGESALVMLNKMIGENRAQLNQAEENIRQLNDRMEGDKHTSAAVDLNQQRDMERLRSQVAGATVAALDLERQIRQERLTGSRTRLVLLQQQLVIAEAGMTFTTADMEKVNARLDAEQQQLERELAEADSRREAVAKSLATAREGLQQIQSQANASLSAVARATEQLELRRAQAEVVDITTNALRFLLQTGTVRRTIWELRFASYQSRSVETIRQTKQRLEQFGRQIELWKSYYQQHGENVATQIARLETRLTDLDGGSELSSELRPLVRGRLEALRECDQVFLRVVRDIERDERLVQQLDDGVREAAGNLPLVGRVNNALSGTGSVLAGLWRLELFVAQDTITVDGQEITGKRSVTLGKVITAILILVVGYWVADVLSRYMEPIFIKRFKIEANQANLIRRWLRVVLVFFLALFSLMSVKIPLTVFAFAGGALAIGLGFGLQTLLKNFVSGIIILFERPFRVGDVLDVAGRIGTMSSIGIRSSVMLLADGTETLIPNSTLLENNLTNWTYSNRVVRFIVTVSVAYGSDARRIVQLLTEIAARHGVVEKSPEPHALFTNFGASALEFELRFWVDVTSGNSAQVSSDLRQMIAGTFAEHKIVFAFPQHDIHLDTTGPLQVHVLSTTSSEATVSPISISPSAEGGSAEASTGPAAKLP